MVDGLASQPHDSNHDTLCIELCSAYDASLPRMLWPELYALGAADVMLVSFMHLILAAKRLHGVTHHPS